jgi:hypothetical protein
LAQVSLFIDNYFMSVNIHVSVLSVATILVCVPAYCQQYACNTTVITVQPRQRVAPPVVGLAAGDLRVKVGGETTRLDAVTDRPTPVRVSILVDTGDKQTQQTWATTRRIVDNVVASLPVGTEFALITFSDKVEQRLALHKDGRSLEDVLKTLSPSRVKGTKEAMVGAINAGTNMFENPRAGDVELLLTASEENFGEKSQTELERQLSLSGLRLFGVSFDFSKLPGHPPTVGGFANIGESFSSLEAISRSSGGIWVRTQASSATDEAGIADSVAKLMSSFFVLHLRPEQSLKHAEDLKIELVNNRRTPPNDVVLLYPQKLWPCQ